MGVEEGERRPPDFGGRLAAEKVALPRSLCQRYASGNDARHVEINARSAYYPFAFLFLFCTQERTYLYLTCTLIGIERYSSQSRSL
jgi:hypothetical protein